MKKWTATDFEEFASLHTPGYIYVLYFSQLLEPE